MKRWAGVLLTFVIMISACSPAGQAAETSYVFEEFDMEVTIPEGDYYVLTRDMDPKSLAQNSEGLTVEQVNEILESDNVYLSAVDHAVTYQLELVVYTNENCETIFNYALLDQELRDAMTAVSKEEIEGQGYTLVGGEVTWYEGEEAVFAVAELVPPGSNDWSYQYQTVYNGRMITVGASSPYLEAPTDEVREQTRLLAEGIHFTRELPVPQAVLEAYEKDEKEGLSLLMIGLRGGIIGGLGCILLKRLKKKKSMGAPHAENEAATGGKDL